jgi:HK97 gp10 family phage protein
MVNFIGTAAHLARKKALGTAADFYAPAGYLETALKARSTYKKLGNVRAAAAGLASGLNVQTAWRFGDSIIGVIGTDKVVAALVKYAVKLVIKSHQADVDAASEMVDLMKSRVPVDTGTLLNGITMEDDDGVITVSASAVRGDADYARFVEFGTRGGTVADESFYENGESAGAALRSRGTGGGSPAQPFFWNSEHEVADKHAIALDNASGEAAKEEGL